MFKCGTCTAKFESKNALVSHVNKEHLEVALRHIDDEELAIIRRIENLHKLNMDAFLAGWERAHPNREGDEICSDKRKAFDNNDDLRKWYDDGFIMAIELEDLDLGEVTRIASLTVDARTEEKRLNAAVLSSMETTFNEDDSTAEEFADVQLSSERMQLLDKLIGYDWRLKWNMTEMKKASAFKKMQLFLFRKEIEPALSWLVEYIDLFQVYTTKDYDKNSFITEFKNMYDGKISGEVAAKIDYIWRTGMRRKLEKIAKENPGE